MEYALGYCRDHRENGQTASFIQVMKPFKEEGLEGLGCGIGEAPEGFPRELEAGDERECT